jgi:exodeoxyribonuclease-3
MPVTLATWNVNSIKVRTEHVRRFIDRQQPDVLMLQEIKCTTENFPHAAFADYPHQIVIGQPSYNGVAILSKIPFDVIHTALPGLDDPQARYIEIALLPETGKPFRAINIYAPNGNPVDSEKYPYKLRWLDALHAHAKTLLNDRVPFLIAGDYNIIPQAIDCWDETVWLGDALFREETWQRWRALQYLGLTDAFRTLQPTQQAYSFWDYQAGAWPRDHGIRIDHVLVSPALADRLQNCTIDKTPRGEEKPSDHTPVMVTLG